MTDGYPKLVGYREARHGCVFLLSDRSELLVEVSVTALDDLLARKGLPALAALADSRSVSVLGDSIGVSEAEWGRIAATLQHAPELTAASRRYPQIGEVLALPYAALTELPVRLLECFDRGCVYAEYRHNFRQWQGQPGWYRGLLTVTPTFQLVVWVSVGTVAVRVEGRYCAGEYVAEPGAAADGPRP